jgi:molecular chaperone DnaK (HSP70)
MLERFMSLQNGHRQTVNELRQSLREAVQDPKSPDEMIQKILQSYQEALNQKDPEVENLRKKLQEILNPRQKAVLIALGML